MADWSKIEEVMTTLKFSPYSKLERDNYIDYFSVLKHYHSILSIPSLSKCQQRQKVFPNNLIYQQYTSQWSWPSSSTQIIWRSYSPWKSYHLSVIQQWWASYCNWYWSFLFYNPKSTWLWQRSSSPWLQRTDWHQLQNSCQWSRNSNLAYWRF